MREFKLRKIEESHFRFDVEIEYSDDGEREKFGFPKGEGWEQEIEGEPKFIRNIKHLIKERGTMEENTLDSVKEKFEGNLFQTSDDVESVEQELIDAEEGE